MACLRKSINTLLYKYFFPARKQEKINKKTPQFGGVSIYIMMLIFSSEPWMKLISFAFVIPMMSSR
jgi:hypothetical protein